MTKYFDDNGPMGEEIKALRGKNLKNRIKEEESREKSRENPVLRNSQLNSAEANTMEKMSNVEIISKAYGFRDFTEQANFVGWNIVQTLMQSASPFATDPAQFVRASLLLAAIGCKDVIGKQDNESAQIVYNKLMRQDVR